MPSGPPVRHFVFFRLRQNEFLIELGHKRHRQPFEDLDTRPDSSRALSIYLLYIYYNRYFQNIITLLLRLV